MTDAVDRLTPLGVAVLALLDEGDMHPYEMIKLLRARRDDRLLSITNGTMYNTVARLERAELLREVGVDREGNRPERTTYSVTDAGTAAAREWVRRELRRVDRPAEFRVALAEAHNLELDETVELLGIRRTALSGALEALRDGHRAAMAKGTPAQYLIETERETELLAADLAWLDRLIHRIGGGRIPWETPEPTERYLAQRKAARL